MTTSVEKLKKILRLEADEGYRDRAVIGGLVRYADTWAREAPTTFGPAAADWVGQVTDRLRSYSQLQERAKREEAVEELLAMLDQGPQLASQGKQTDEGSPRPTSRATEPKGLDAPVTVLRGVGKRQAERLSRLGMETVRDMLYTFPRRYDDFSNLKSINRLEYEEEVTVVAQVESARARRTRSGRPLFKAVLTDGTGHLEVTWFNQPYLAERIRPGRQIVVSGQVDEYLGRLCLVNPEWETLRKELLHTGRLVPVYPLTEGVGARWLRQLVKRTVDYWAPRISDYLPASVRASHDLMELPDALQSVHFPDRRRELEQARYRLAFGELFVFQLALLRQRQEWRSVPGRQLEIPDEALQSFILSLPFHLTGAQHRALGQIVEDMRSPHAMNRLLQGDVGSGKTVVAAAAMALAVTAGAQSVMMAPTEILAEQHFDTLSRLFERLPGKQPVIRLLTGSVTGAEREEIYAGLADGSIDIAVGTHALIQGGVTFDDLAMVVIDEQHRFGVEQRAALRQKGYNPHVLVMTATPIPRSLQLTVWGHLDVSVIDEMPPGRQPVTTRVILPKERERAYAFLRSQVEKGHQAFIICPLVEESDKIEAKAAVEEYERLQETIFPDLRLGLLHGRKSSAEKDAVMSRFVQGELDILVATSVVEVGIDVPNATVMLVEGADRFGLAQLHQFRGRVGRGEHASYCLLVSDSSASEAQERLSAVEATTDGFALAEKDLKMRGPGEFLGTRQSGFSDLEIASLTNLRLLETAREAARRLFERDPELTRPEHQLLAQKVAEVERRGGEVS